MEKRILFNCASRSRPDKLHGLLKNIMDHVFDPINCIFLFKIDPDDPKLRGYQVIIDDFADRSEVYTAIRTSKNKIDAINRNIFPNGWDIIIDASDDFVFKKKGFDDIIRQHCGPDDCLHFPEPYATDQNKANPENNIIIMPVMGREYYNRFGYIYNPEYKSLFCDNELTAVAKILGRYKYIPEDIFYHHHPAAGYGKADAQLRFTQSFWNEDKRTFNKRKAINFGL